MPKEQDWHAATAAEMRVLQQLQQALPQASAEELAALLQIDIQPARPSPHIPNSEQSAQPVIHSQQGQPATQPATGSYPPADKTVPFLYLHSIEFKQAQPESTEQPDWYTQCQPFEGEIDSKMAAPVDPLPLLPWQQLWPVLHQIFRDHKQTRRLDTRRLIRHAVRREPLTAIPWQRRLRWPGELVLLVDYSRHLCPYYSDYQQLTQQLQYWLRERLKLVICVDAEQQQYVYHGRKHSGLPPCIKHTEMLYLGDLGCLDQHGVSYARWYQTGHQLQQRNVRVEALLTVAPADWQHDLKRYYQLHSWDFGRIVSAQQSKSHSSQSRGAVSQAQLQQLMPYLAQAFELTPALIRRMRQILGLAVSVESLVVQHPALQGNRIYFQWRDQAQRKLFRQQLTQQQVEQAWEIISQFESALPQELQIEQRQQLGVALSDEHRPFIGSVVQSHLQHSLSDASQSLLLGWIKRMVQRAADESWSEATESLYALYWREHKNSQDCVIPSGVDPTRLPLCITNSAVEEQTLRVSQQGRQLLLQAVDSAVTGMDLARLHWHEGSVLATCTPQQTEKKPLWPSSRITVPTDAQTELIIDTPRQRLTLKSLTCPTWASGLGRDRYGVFAELTVNTVALLMRWIPPGEFMMGSPQDEPERFDREDPQHRVRFAQGFWLAETACTQALWKAVMGDNPSRFSEDSQNPVEKVDWETAKQFIAKLNQQAPDLALRLPSEAEWEYACRAGTTTPFWFGTELNTEQVNYDGNYPYANGEKGEYREQTVPVKTFRPNPWGLYQMHGNVWEWCEDRWHDSYTDAPVDGRAWTDGDSKYHVCRGGSWLSNGRGLRSAYRGRDRFDFFGGRSGFRLARGPELQPVKASRERSRR